jgi:hypothetical protein
MLWGEFKMEFNESMSSDQFLDFLFSKVSPLKDELDLQDDDSCCDHLEFEKVFQFSLF